jgi:outer membrane receptor for ferrienterochelin and colicins
MTMVQTTVSTASESGIFKDAAARPISKGMRGGRLFLAVADLVAVLLISAPAPASELDRIDSPVAEDEVFSLNLEDLLDQVVVSATRTEMRQDEAPAITTVITRDQINRWGYHSIEEILRHVAGFFVIDDHVIPNVGVRGISGGLRSESGLIKVMIDGSSVAFRSTAGNWLGPELVPLSIVERVEVIRGPASALYGADAFLGVVNIVTRRPRSMNGGEIGISGNYSEGNPGWGQDAGMGAALGRWDIMAAYRTYVEDHTGLKLASTSPAPHLPSYVQSDWRSQGLGQKSATAYLRIGTRVSSTTSISLSGYYSQLDRDADFADWAQLTHGVDREGRSNGTVVSLRQGMLVLSATTSPTPNLDLQLNVAGMTGKPTSRDRIDVGSEMYYVRRDFGYRAAEAQLEAKWRLTRNLTVLGAAGLVRDWETLPSAFRILKTTLGSGHAGDVAPMASSRVGDIVFTNPGAHAQIVWKSPTLPISGVLGGRYDHHNIYGEQLSTRAGGVVGLGPSINVKLLYGSAFKAPSPQLLYGFPISSGDIAGNPALKPSFVHTFEGQISLHRERLFVLTTGIAYNLLLDQAAFAQSGANQVARNLSRVGAFSWETELRFDYRGLITGYANFALNHTIHSSQEPGYVAQLTSYSNPAYPVALGHVGVMSTLRRLYLRLSAEADFVSSRPSSPTNTLENGGEYRLRPYATLGANIQTTGLRLVPRRETILTLSGRNLLGTSISEPGFAGVDYPQLGRKVIFSVRQEW